MIKFNELFEVPADKTLPQEIQSAPQNTENKIPWIDKYRPRKLQDVVHQDEVIKMLEKTLETGDLPHLLFYGPPGTGKTSTILAVARQLFGPRVVKERVIELNASDERGINVVRNKIVTFAKISIGRKDPKYLCPPYKIIILDEADAMTTEAQSALRKTIEDNARITRFCFICNYINQIIEPINSRCVKFRFKSLTNDCINDRLKYISSCEKMTITDDALNTISTLSEGDMRKAVMLLQNLKYCKDDININNVFDIAGYVPTDVVAMIKKVCIDSKSTDLTKVVELTQSLYCSGFPINCILGEINKLLINSTVLKDEAKSNICLHIAKTERRLIDGADEYLQLLSIFTCIRNTILEINSNHYITI